MEGLDPYELATLLSERILELDHDQAADALKLVLDTQPVKPLIEYVFCERLKQGEREHWDVLLSFSDQGLRRTHLRHEPIGTDELERLAG